MRHPNRNRARSLRRNQTPAEALLWSRLRRGNLLDAKFRRQVPLGPFIVDFLCHKARLIIEADGGQHGLQLEKDAARTAWLEGAGYKVLRFWNNEIFNHTDAVMDVIGEAIHWSTHPASSSAKRMR
jgi:very-short-patch-repair endonuclease